MTKDRRYLLVRDSILAGTIKEFRQIFDAIPKSVVYRDLGMNYERFEKILSQLELFTFLELRKISDKMELDPKILIDMVYRDMMNK